MEGMSGVVVLSRSGSLVMVLIVGLVLTLTIFTSRRDKEKPLSVADS
ncbi:hypothetical protein DSUL_260004 [Desulfovibrionales bacterium]